MQQLRKTVQPKYYSKCIWRRLFVLNKKKFLNYDERFVATRASTIPIIFIRFKMYFYNGTMWVPRIINRWMVGYKFGEFTWNRKIALYKAKQLKKKKK